MPLMVSTTAGTGIVHFLPRETYGWVFPAVMSRLYKLNFVSPVDFQVRLSFTGGRGRGQLGCRSHDIAHLTSLSITAMYTDSSVTG